MWICRRRVRRLLLVLFPFIIIMFVICSCVIFALLTADVEGGKTPLPRVTVDPISLRRVWNTTDECLTEEYKARMADYPECAAKLAWIQKGWKEHKCYSWSGVDGSMCSFVAYLSEVEHHCPPRTHTAPRAVDVHYVQVNTNLSSLFALFADSRVNYEYMKKRIDRIWPKWVEAFNYNLEQHPFAMKERRKLKIMVHLGFLTQKAGTGFGEKSTHGGPLGELVQWSDLLASLHLLGHELYISTEISTMQKHALLFSRSSPCPSRDDIDLVITDIMGLIQMRRKRTKPFYDAIRCRLRVVDSFGTHAEFNQPSVYRQMKSQLGGKKNPWGGHGLQLPQFWTLFPHTPDNTFLGFVVDLPDVSPMFPRSSSEPAVLVYGKEAYMWSGKSTAISVANQLAEVHATVADPSNSTLVPTFVKNHGFLQEKELHSLLSSVRVFLGLGFPFEGPAPLEAIAHGAVFINARFREPVSRLNHPFFAEKPTIRELSSQCPYAAGVGSPWVRTVDIEDEAELRDAIREAIHNEPSALIPVELTPAGMLLRVSRLVDKQDYCSSALRWPPKHSGRGVASESGESCESACAREGLVCEPHHWNTVNTEHVLSNLLGCSRVSKGHELTDPSDCRLQTTPSLFSCAAKKANVRRVCPCRNYVDGQIALCKECLV